MKEMLDKLEKEIDKMQKQELKESKESLLKHLDNCSKFIFLSPEGTIVASDKLNVMAMISGFLHRLYIEGDLDKEELKGIMKIATMSEKDMLKRQEKIMKEMGL